MILRIRNDGFAATNGAGRESRRVREAEPGGIRVRAGTQDRGDSRVEDDNSNPDDATDPAAAQSAAARDGAVRGPADGASARRRRR